MLIQRAPRSKSLTLLTRDPRKVGRFFDTPVAWHSTCPTAGWRDGALATEIAADSVEFAENRPKRGRTPGSGRKPGTPNRATLVRRELVRAMTAANATPLEFLLAVMRSDSPLIDMKMRIDAARSALPFCHVRAGEEKPPDPKLVEAQPKPPWEVDAERREYLLAQQRIGKVRPGGALERELEGLLEAEREKESIGF